MNFQRILESLRGFSVIIKMYQYEEKILFQGEVKDIPYNLKNEKWLVAEVKLIDICNYNSGYVLTVY